MNTISKFAAALKERLREKDSCDFLIPEGLPYSEVTAGDPAAIDWVALDAAIDEFAAEFKAKKLMGG